MLDEIRKIYENLLEKIICCDESEYQSEDLRFLLNAAFELGDFVWKFGNGDEYDWSTCLEQSNIFTIKTMCQLIHDKSIDYKYMPFEHASQLPQRFTQAIEDTKKYLKDEGSFELLKCEWTTVLYRL